MLPRLVRRIVIIEKSPSRLRFPSEFSVRRRLMAIFRMHNAPQPNIPRRGGPRWKHVGLVMSTEKGFGSNESYWKNTYE